MVLCAPVSCSNNSKQGGIHSDNVDGKASENRQTL